MRQRKSKAIQGALDQDKRTEGAKPRFLNRIKNAPDRGTKGRIRWSREELHKR